MVGRKERKKKRKEDRKRREEDDRVREKMESQKKRSRKGRKKGVKTETCFGADLINISGRPHFRRDL